MEIPTQITFRDLEHTPAIDEAIRKRVTKIGSIASDLVSCRVIVESPHHRHRKGNIYHVRADVFLKGREVVVGREPAVDPAHSDIYVAIRDVFDAVERQVHGHHGKRRERRRATQ